MKFEYTPECQRDLKKLTKKYRSLPQDLEVLYRVLKAAPLGTTTKHFNVITQTQDVYIVKARLFCRYLKGTALRVVYAYHGKHQNIRFIEIYFKGNKPRENRTRIKTYLNPPNPSE